MPQTVRSGYLCRVDGNGTGATTGTAPAMTLEDLRAAAGSGEIDTVLLALTDMQGRLQGKRLTASHFLEAVADHGAEACNYLLAVDVEMNTVPGYAMSSWEHGYGDFEMTPDLSTLRRIPWHDGTALCLADLHWGDHSPVVASPRQILRRQIERLAERGMEAFAATGAPSPHCRSATHSAVPSCHGTSRSVSRSGFISKSP